MGEPPATPGTPVARLPHVAGRRCLDFVNTLVAADEPVRRDSLLTPQDYRSWAKRAGISLDPPAEPATEARALARARALRETLLAIGLALVEGRPCPPDAMADLTRAVARSFRSRRLVAQKGGLGWARTHRDLDSVTDLLAVEAAELFAGGKPFRLKRCAGEHCGWFFLDTSRNGLRRWCSMSDCGNRAKARRHRARLREAEAETA